MIFNRSLKEYTGYLALQTWINQAVALCQPSEVWLCDGSEEENRLLLERLVKSGTLTPLKNGCFLARSDPSDVARVEECTFIVTETKEEAGPTNNWMDPEEMGAVLSQLFRGSMQGRTLYVIPFCMGPLSSPFAKIGIQITDSPYVVVNMRIMTRMGKDALSTLQEGAFVPCMHSVGRPLKKGEQDVPWPCNTANRIIAHFPATKAIWSYGSGYGGNALLGKKCLALRIASCLAREEGWLAEHMLIMGVTNPAGVKKYFVAAFPSACGKTNLALLKPALPGWKVEVVGDDIAWIHLGEDGRLYAINPENGFFGVAPGTNWKSNPYAMEAISKNTLFTNCALNDEGEAWWEGKTKEPPAHLISWLGKEWRPGGEEKAAHPNARFTAPLSQCPILDPAFQAPLGVPLSAILFGGRRSDLEPLVYEANDFVGGVLVGASLASETTAAGGGAVGRLRHDPFAMLPFLGYPMGDYFAHWLSFKARTKEELLPKIFAVNWFRKDEKGDYLWPGFGENIRVLQWIFERTEGTAEAKEVPFGHIPAEGTLNTEGLNLKEGALEELFRVDREGWLKKLEETKNYFGLFGKRCPPELYREIERIEAAFVRP